MPSIRALSFVVIAGLWSAACGDASSSVRPIVSTPAPVVPPSAANVTLVATSITYYVGTPRADATPPTVRVVSASGVPVAGIVVVFHVEGGGGSIADTLVKSDAAGLATCGRWTLGDAEGLNSVSARTLGGSGLTFLALGLRPALAGIRYDLRMRDGSSLRPGEEGFLILAADSTFRTVWTWGAGGPNPYVSVNAGRYTKTGSAITFADYAQYVWADGTLVDDVLTFRYDDYLDIGFHYVIVEVYARRQ